MGSTRVQNHIRRLRFEHGEMTQQDLATRVYVTRQTINAIELGKYSPSLEVAFRISRVFGKPLEAVFSWPGDAQDAADEQGSGPRLEEAGGDGTS